MATGSIDVIQKILTHLEAVRATEKERNRPTVYRVAV